MQNHIWINKNEIPSNGIDDDGNGYIDDVHRWNFLGNVNGENIVDGSFESSREYFLLKPLFDNVTDIKHVEQKDRKKYKLWLSLDSLHTTDSAANAIKITSISQQLKSFLYTDSLLHTIIHKDTLYESDMDQLKSAAGVAENLKDSIEAVFTNYVGSFNSLEKYISQKGKTLNQLLIK